jgi:4-aminobutyrate aminotransferase-like enzyme
VIKLAAMALIAVAGHLLSVARGLVMPEEHPTIADLSYELLKRVQGALQEMRLDVQELKLRASSVDDHRGGLMIAVSGVNTRLDRIDERVQRLERRLDLTEGDNARRQGPHLSPTSTATRTGG